MIRSVLGSRASIGGPLGSGRGGGVTLPAWAIAGGVSAANVIGCYQPKGAASLAASYADLTGNGYNAAPGVAPTFDTPTGWNFDGATQWLDSGILPGGDQTWSIIVRVQDWSNASGYHCVAASKSSTWGLGILNDASNVIYENARSLLKAGTLSANGIYAVAGRTPYKDAVSQGTITANTVTMTQNICFGRYGTTGFFGQVKILAAAIYNAVLTAPQVAAISSAMSLL